MAEQINAGYKIISHIVVDELEFVLGFNPKAAQQYVTWEYSPRAGFYWGHYFSDENDAVADLLERARRELHMLTEVTENDKEN